jgi:RNA polymerase sigma factor (sigma-70 family)
MEDLQLLREYAESGSERAFAELVRRHVDLVYSTARRLAREATVAEDVTQMVFIRLARKAGALRDGTVLTGWLYRTTRFVAETVGRSDWRRRQRESVAMELTQLDQNSESVWKEVSPLLEEAMAGLRATDQNAVLLRFFAGKNLREVGDALGISDDAAQKRVDRALGRLRNYFARRGVVISAVVLAPILAQHAVQAAPIGVATSLVTSAASASGASAGIGAGNLFKVMAIAKLKTSTAGMAAVVLLLTGVVAVLKLLPDSTTHAQAAAPANPLSTSALVLRGNVRLPNGKPLAGALVRVATPDAYVRLYQTTNSGVTTATNRAAISNTVSNPVAPSRRDAPAPSTLTTADGSFSIGLPTFPRDGKAVIVVSDDAGYAITTADALSVNPELVVQAWGRIEGVLRIGKTLASDRTVQINIWGSGPIYEWNMVSHWQSAQTDANGRFVFPRVAPMDVWLTHNVMVWPGEARPSGHHHVKVSPGDSIVVQLGGTGRAVTGRIEWSGDDKLFFYGTMWANQKHYMRDPPGWRTMSAEQKRQYELEWRDSADGELFKDEVRNYEFPVQRDGTFRVPDVLPGSYRMQVRADVPRVAGQSARLAAAAREIKVVVPDMAVGDVDEPIDVGTLTPLPK